MPANDRATALRDLLTRLYPSLQDAPGYLNERSPGLYDRLVGGGDDAQAFGELGTMFPTFGDELSRCA